MWRRGLRAGEEDKKNVKSRKKSEKVAKIRGKVGKSRGKVEGKGPEVGER